LCDSSAQCNQFLAGCRVPKRDPVFTQSDKARAIGTEEDECKVTFDGVDLFSGRSIANFQALLTCPGQLSGIRTEGDAVSNS
jgi:hypothetical protein